MLVTYMNALEVLSNNDLTWDQWSRVGAALYNATGGSDDGLELFHAWSAKSSKYRADRTDARWRHWDDGHAYKALTAGTVIYLAREADPNWVSPSQQRFAKWLEDADLSPEEEEELSGRADFDPAAFGCPPGQAEQRRRVELRLRTIEGWLNRDIPPTDNLMGELFSTTTQFIGARAVLGAAVNEHRPREVARELQRECPGPSTVLPSGACPVIAKTIKPRSLTADPRSLHSTADRPIAQSRAAAPRY
jgi:hypothetical protein